MGGKAFLRCSSGRFIARSRTCVLDLLVAGNRRLCAEAERVRCVRFVLLQIFVDCCEVVSKGQVGCSAGVNYVVFTADLCYLLYEYVSKGQFTAALQVNLFAHYRKSREDACLERKSNAKRSYNKIGSGNVSAAAKNHSLFTWRKKIRSETSLKKRIRTRDCGRQVTRPRGHAAAFTLSPRHAPLTR